MTSTPAAEAAESGAAAPDPAIASPVNVTIDDGVATIRLDRGKLNPLNAAMQDQLAAVADELADDATVAAVVITGGPKVFAAGADIVEMAGLDHTAMIHRARRLSAAFTKLAELPKPVVAAVNGYALGGGCELALCADRRIVGRSAVFGQPEIALGVIPGAGGTQRLARLIGPSRAKDLIYTGRFVDAEAALAMGLADEVVPDAETEQRATAWARQFVGGPALALRAAKEAIDVGLGTDLATGLSVERQLFAALFATEDRTIGMRSFVENGPGQATFVGR